ncbi:MAG: MFS transporter [Xanthomonadaceae bacterium]|nr:MFS transporter [Xanthomonadaceae bacterium]MDE1964720.1 MFS transporter [Xanthomonadaceae bacterium]
MRTGSIAFHHPLAFWFGSALLVAGVLLHLPMYLMAAPMHYRLAGMPMSDGMLLGMALIPLGLGLAGYGLAPPRPLDDGARHRHHVFHLADGVSLNRAHLTLVSVLMVALAVDVMKPATLGFVMPGLTREYGISKETGALLALVALTGTTLGSIAWGWIGDRFGRRSAMLLSALMFMGTAICGAMPSFGWNLVMCFLMGASAGGLLPITFTLMAEAIPATHRGWLLVALGGIGTSAGYLLAAGAAAWLEPGYSWRALWLLGLPTGAVIIVLNHWIPESSRFLASQGRWAEARAVLARYAGTARFDVEEDSPQHPGAPVLDDPHAVLGLRDLLRGKHGALTRGLLICGVAWGLANFGFLLWLPVNLVKLGVDPSGASRLLADSAVFALPGIALVVWLYHRWSTVRALVLFIGLSTLALLAFVALDLAAVRQAWLITLATAGLLVSVSGVIAMLIPYAAEIYPVHLRSTGSGVVAASSKFGGILGALLGVGGLFEHLALAAGLIALAMLAAGITLLRHGVETRGLTLEAIQSHIRGPWPAGNAPERR